MAQEITRTSGTATEDATTAPTEPLEQDGGFAGFVAFGGGPTMPLSLLDDPNYAASDSPITSYTPAAAEDSSAPS